jgi:PAS domain S-box-containing protein
MRERVRGVARRHKVVLQLVGVTLLLWSVAWFNRKAALPPLHATPVWLPAGLVVLAVLAVGLRVLPALFVAGIWIGWPTIDYAYRDAAHGGLDQPLALVAVGAVMLGCGLVGQAIVAWRFGRDLVAHPTTTDLRSALTFLVIVGPVACVISATFGVAELRVLDIIPASEAPSSFFVWWTGDTLGALLLAPLAILVSPSMAGARRAMAMLAVVVATTIIIVGTYVLVERIEVQRVRSAFRVELSRDADRVEEHVDDIVRGLDRSRIALLQRQPLPTTPAPLRRLSKDTPTVDYLPAASAPRSWAREVAKGSSSAYVDTSGATGMDGTVRIYAPLSVLGNDVGEDGSVIGYVVTRLTLAQLLGDHLRRTDRDSAVQVRSGGEWIAVTPRSGNLVTPAAKQAGHIDDAGTGQQTPTKAARDNGLIATAGTTIDVLGQHWPVYAGARERYVRGRSFSAATLPLALLSVGLATLAGTIVLLLSGARARLEVEILRRTRQLRQSEQRYRLVVETSESGIVHVDGDGIVTFANRAWPLVVGAFAEEDPIGHKLTRYLDPASAAAFEAAHARIVDGRSNVETIELHVATGGTAPATTVELVAMPFEIDADTPGVLVTLTARPASTPATPPPSPRPAPHGG